MKYQQPPPSIPNLPDLCRTWDALKNMAERLDEDGAVLDAAVVKAAMRHLWALATKINRGQAELLE